MDPSGTQAELGLMGLLLDRRDYESRREETSATPMTQDEPAVGPVTSSRSSWIAVRRRTSSARWCRERAGAPDEVRKFVTNLADQGPQRWQRLVVRLERTHWVPSSIDTSRWEPPDVGVLQASREAVRAQTVARARGKNFLARLMPLRVEHVPDGAGG